MNIWSRPMHCHNLPELARIVCCGTPQTHPKRTKRSKIDKLLEKSQKQMKQGISSRHEPLNMNPRTSGHMSKQIRCDFIMHQKMIIHQKIYTIDEMS